MLSFGSLCFFSLFIIKLFKRPNSVFKVIHEKYGSATYTLIRRYEKLSIKHTKLQLGIKFLESCQQYNIVPKFLHFRLSLPNYSKTRTYSDAQHQFLQLQINTHRDVTFIALINTKCRFFLQ